ncbi:hypothetical protein MY5147_008683, partial [Beauveria neobassiana]
MNLIIVLTMPENSLASAHNSSSPAPAAAGEP